MARAYETLVQADCAGRLFPALASRWSGNEGSSVTITLRPAQFWTGDRVTASNVIESWRSSDDSLAASLAAATVVIDDSTLRIGLPPSELASLASPRLVVTRPLAGSAWPEGTGSHRIRRADAILIQPVRENLTTFEVRTTTATEARNLIDEGADVLITDDPATAAYAARRLSAEVVPLPWDRTWVFVIPASSSSSSSSSSPSPSSSTSSSHSLSPLSADLAHDAVRANARVAMSPAWTTEAPVCFAAAQPTRSARIAYEQGDPTARTLAERLAAVASAPGGGASSLRSADPALASAPSRITVLPMARDAFDAAIRAGAELAFVTSIPFRSSRNCAGARIIPLVETRWQIVMRPGIGGSP
jgi:hypothetical protein